MVQKGLLVVLSGPSGAGKGTVCKALAPVMPDMGYSISCTTRQPREGEVEGVNYFFKTREEFKRMMEQDELLEWAEVYGNYYGTPLHYVEEQIAMGKNVLLEIEMQGAMQVKKKYPNGVFIFLIPPSLEELKKRILGRGTETEESFNLRFGAAAGEMKYINEYDYVVVNDEVEKAVDRIRSIITAELCSVKRNREYYNKLIQEGQKNAVSFD
ncbi:guanylate kinase [Effusibacillus lacus]|uniref:Guanylate kinase n=1 Tax=Effusibacillus lacus TaxID=1348429 RepID=A0A292YKG4_9BACL|nr:guanylate kinase [Effusibacillus lacus]TCS76551.1 guanylate kinase [Effusibacillus lacus]GAX90428.1 guanylate kinase [Effusibacillus lacus]